MRHQRSQKLPISLTILAKNEEKCLDFCLPSLKNFVKEIIVFDTGSRDQTKKVAQSHGAKVIVTTIDKNNRSNTRNRLIDCAAQPWILMFDADYRIAEKDLPKLASIINHPMAEAYRLRIRNYSNRFPLFHHWKLCQNKYPKEEKFSKCFGYYDSTRTILFRNQPEIRCRGHIHDTVEPLMNEARLSIIDSGILVHHFEHFKGMRHHLKKHADYARCERKDVKKWPREKIGYVNLISDLILTAQDGSEARQWAFKLLKLAPRDSQSWCLQAMIEMQGRRFNLAQKFLIKSVAIRPLFSNLYLLGWLYLRKGDFDKSRLFLKRALKKQPEHPLVINLLGILKERSGQYREALLLFQKASLIHPGYADAVFNQAVIHEKTGRGKESRRLYHQAKRLAMVESR